MNEIIKIEYDGNYSVKEFTIDGEVYILEGYCSRCGKCCINPNYNVGFNDENGRCSKLITENIDGKEIYVCSIYSRRPIGCLLWPTCLKDLQDIPDCTLKLNKKIQ